MLRYLKALVIGILAGTLVSVLWAALTAYLWFRAQGAEGAGGLGAISIGVPSIPWVVGFALGFVLMLRRRPRNIG